MAYLTSLLTLITLTLAVPAEAWGQTAIKGLPPLTTPATPVARVLAQAEGLELKGKGPQTPGASLPSLDQLSNWKGEDALAALVLWAVVLRVVLVVGSLFPTLGKYGRKPHNYLREASGLQEENPTASWVAAAFQGVNLVSANDHRLLGPARSC